jgi:hypothetical protein
MNSIESLIQRAAYFEGSLIPVSYDRSRKESYGYYICRFCLNQFEMYWDLPDPLHKKTCIHTVGSCAELKLKREGLIYVLVPNDRGRCSPFRSEVIETIKAFFRERFV